MPHREMEGGGGRGGREECGAGEERSAGSRSATCSLMVGSGIFPHRVRTGEQGQPATRVTGYCVGGFGEILDFIYLLLIFCHACHLWPSFGDVA